MLKKSSVDTVSCKDASVEHQANYFHTPCNNTSGFRVVRVYFRFPPELGGMETHIAQLSVAQRELGVEVLNLYSIGEEAPLAIRLFSKYSLSHIRPAVLRNAIFYANALSARNKVRGTKPTILHVHGDWSDFLFSKPLAIAIGANVVVASIHDSISRSKRMLYRPSLSHCDLVFVTGKNDQIILQKLLNREIYHCPSAPLDLFFEIPKRNKNFSCDVIIVANFFRKKRLDIVLECAKRRPQLRFAILGHGPEYEEIVKLTAERNINNLVFLGRCKPVQVAEALQAAKVFLLTSEQEGTPTAALEAMAAGLPVILTPSNRYDWLVKPGENGFITSSWEINEIVARIDEVLSDESYREIMGQSGRRFVMDNHTWRANAMRINSLMAKCLELRIGG